MGISGGFAAVFGTPLAGALFALEVVYFSGLQPKSIIWSFITAYVAHYTVLLWSVSHTHYHIPQVPEISMSVIFWVVGCSVLFGFASMLFSRSTQFWSRIFSLVTYSPLRPFIGGIVIASVVYAIDTTKYIGLGIPMLTGAFVQANAIQDFAIKILFTSFTLGAGFKGGEVTPLFISRSYFRKRLICVCAFTNCVVGRTRFCCCIFRSNSHAYCLLCYGH